VKQITTTSADPPFITPEIKTLLREKNKLMRKGQLSKANNTHDKIGQLIRNYNSKRLANIETSDSKSIWELVRQFTGKTTHTKPDCKLTADQLNEHYASISTDLHYVEPTLLLTASSNADPFEVHEIHRSISKLRRTATGQDNIPYWILKLGADFICVPLTKLLNASLKLSLVPEQWKRANITPISKVKMPEKPADFRPISIISILSRTAERLVVRKFINPAIENNDAFSDQFAFRPTGSTTSAIIAITTIISQHLETQAYVRVVALDFSRAFDTVRHIKLIQKCRNTRQYTKLDHQLLQRPLSCYQIQW